jgi:hypothetical protein
VELLFPAQPIVEVDSIVVLRRVVVFLLFHVSCVLMCVVVVCVPLLYPLLVAGDVNHA